MPSEKWGNIVAESSQYPNTKLKCAIMETDLPKNSQDSEQENF